jgi:glycosyltransferase involved in cell wall biosynthesis
MVQANVAALLARRLAGGRSKLVVAEHNTMSRASSQSVSRKEGTMPLFARLLYPYADGVITVSKGVADDLVRMTGIDSEKVKVIYNPVVREDMFARAREAVAHPWVQDSSVPLIVAVGRLNRQKDFMTLIRAFAELHRHKSARLLILGEGEERSALESLVKELGLESCVSLPGFVSNPYAYLARARLFVLSSQWEGLPTVLIEAISLGVPVVSTDCESGPREILDHGKYGHLVAVGDSAALAMQMRAALDEPVAPIPREAWCEFSEDAAVENYLNYIRGL